MNESTALDFLLHTHRRNLGLRKGYRAAARLTSTWRQSTSLCPSLIPAVPPTLATASQPKKAHRFGRTYARSHLKLTGSTTVKRPALGHAVTGFTNKSLRGQVAGLLGRDYSTSQMSYDLRRLRLHGLIERTPGTNTYTVTPEGIRVAVFYTKLHGRLLRPLLDAHQPPAPIELRRALGTIEHVLGDYIANARLGTAA